MMKIEINFFNKRYQDELAEFVLQIQNNEFNLGFTRNEQPDLINTEEFYKNGGFWIARIEGGIIGSIGLEKIDSENGIVRKLFVKKEFRGDGSLIAQKLYNLLISRAKEIGFNKILLDTPSVAKASHRFYEKNGFIKLNQNEIPKYYKYPDRNSLIYQLKLD
jgi:N-acetylglutamate synthase-like GNAT family acetyltransferase